MAMTRRDYERIAGTIRSLTGLSPGQRRYVATRFADRLVDTNPQFNMARFLQACQPDVKQEDQ